MSGLWGQMEGVVSTDWVTDDPRKMVVTSRLTYTDPYHLTWIVRPGQEINGASTGWFLRRLFPAYVGRYRRATVFHDTACEAKLQPSWKVHRMFFAAMRYDGVWAWKAWVMWAAVRTFGPRF